MADADLIHSRKDDLQKWLKARGLKPTGRKQELIDRALKAKQNGIETTVEREAREREQQEKRAAEKLQTPVREPSESKDAEQLVTGFIQTAPYNLYRNLKRNLFMAVANFTKAKI